MMQHGVTGRSPLRLSRLIEALCTDTRCSSLTAAHFFHSTFQAIKDFTDVFYTLPVETCWAGHLESSTPRPGVRGVLLPSLILYFESRMSPSAVQADSAVFSTPNHSIDVPGDMIYLDPERLAQLIEEAGAEVPSFLMRGKSDKKSAPAKQADYLEVREWRTARQITQALVQILVAASHRDGATIRQAALRLGQKGQLHTDARILRELAETLGLDFPRKTDTLVKYLESPDEAD